MKNECFTWTLTPEQIADANRTGVLRRFGSDDMPVITIPPDRYTDYDVVFDPYGRWFRMVLTKPTEAERDMDEPVEPMALNVDRLAAALGGYVRYRHDECGAEPPCEHDRAVAFGLAAEYDRLRRRIERPVD